MRTYGEAIDVRTGADPLSGSDAPAQFLWRGRLYLVRDVLAHWVELGTWWSVRGPRAPRAGSTTRSTAGRSGGAGSAATSRPSAPAAPAARAAPSPQPVGSEQVGSEPTRSVSADVGAVEREVWRVEASSGRSGTRGVYDLVRDVPAVSPRADGSTGPPARERWRLARALD